MTTMQTRAARRAGAAVAVPAPRRDGDLVGSLAALEPTGEVPLHLQLRSVLDEAVDSSGLAHGERIWSESQLMRHYGVSRHVVRQALNQLVLEGRLSVRKGAGYFVNRRRVVRNLHAITTTARPGVEASGETFTIELIDIGVGPTLEPAEAELVPRRHRPRVHRIRRLGRIDGEPVALMTAAFPATLAKVVTRRVIEADQTFAALVQQGMRPGRAEIELEVTFASGADSVLLEVAEGAPLVVIRTRLYTDSGDLLALTRQRYRSDRFTFAYQAAIGADGWAVGTR